MSPEHCSQFSSCYADQAGVVPQIGLIVFVTKWISYSSTQSGTLLLLNKYIISLAVTPSEFRYVFGSIVVSTTYPCAIKALLVKETMKFGKLLFPFSRKEEGLLILRRFQEIVV